MSTLTDFRDLIPMVVMQALQSAGAVVCEPYARARIETTWHLLGQLLAELAREGSAIKSQLIEEEYADVTAVLPSARMPDFHRRLPGLTGGEGVIESDVDGHRPVKGSQPIRARTKPSPLDRDAYLRSLRR